MGRIKSASIILITILLQTAYHVYAGELSPELSQILHYNKQKEYISVIIRMIEQTDMQVSTKDILGRNKALRSRNVIKTLQSTSTAGQKDIIIFLEKEKAMGNVVNYTPFWIFNDLALKATPKVIKEIASRYDVEIVSEDIPIFLPVLFPSTPLKSDPLYTWNMKRFCITINIPQFFL